MQDYSDRAPVTADYCVFSGVTDRRHDPFENSFLCTGVRTRLGHFQTLGY